MIERYHTLDEEGRRVHVEVDFDPINLSAKYSISKNWTSATEYDTIIN